VETPRWMWAGERTGIAGVPGGLPYTKPCTEVAMSYLMRPSCRLSLSKRVWVLADGRCLPLHRRTVDRIESAERPGDGRALVQRGASSTGAARSQEER
jgi:hypothetical protein